MSHHGYMQQFTLVAWQMLSANREFSKFFWFGDWSECDKHAKLILNRGLYF